MSNERFMKNANAIDVVLKILQGFAVAAIILCAVFIPLVKIFGDSVYGGFDEIQFGVLKFTLAGDLSTYLNTAKLENGMIITLAAGIITSAVIWYGLKVLRNIISPMKQGLPFTEGISAQMKKLAAVTLIGGAALEITKALEAYFEFAAYDWTAVFDTSRITDIAYGYEMNGAFIVIALILFFLAYIFKYGEQLQKESDETL